MRQYTAFFLVALVALTLSLRVKQDPSSPADRVLQRVDSLVDASRNEQAEQSRIYANQSQRCVDEKAFRRQEVKDGQVASGNAATQLATCSGELPNAQGSLDQANAELQRTNDQLAGLVQEYGVYNAANNDRAQQHVDALNAISGAYNIIGDFSNGASALNTPVFVQVAEKLNKIVKIAIKQRFHQHLKPVMTALVQVTASPEASLSTSALQQVVALLRRLEANVRASDESRINQWNAYEALYNKQTALLKEQVSALTAIIASYNSYIQNLNACVAKETSVKQQADDKVSRNQAVLDASIAMCDAYDVQYAQQTKERNDYIALLGQLRSFIVNVISKQNSGQYSVGDFQNQ